jgi:transcriptional regulator with GAF, ATPase, and Fis domain
VVALKIASAAENGAWLGREGALLARLARRWGPELVDAGITGDGARFLASRWVDGEPLSSLIPGASDRVRLATMVAHGIGRGLDELHALGVRHGDVKPANIVVGDGRATLIDLDLARDVEDDGAIGGTVHYLAPEVRAGDAATPAADLFALGVTLGEITRDGGVGAWVDALTASSPGARPSAAWIAGQAARCLGLTLDRTDIVADRRARVRRAYLALRTAASGALDEAIEGPARAWLDHRGEIARKLGVTEGGHVAPLDALGIARWLVALVGPSAAAWPVVEEREGSLAERLLALCESAPPEAWALDDVLRGRTRGPSATVSEDPLSLTRALLAPRPDEATLETAEAAIAREDMPASLAVDLATALLRRGEIGRAFVAISRVPDDSAHATLLRGEIARRRGDLALARVAATSAAADAGVRDSARALLARLAWDAGEVDRAEAELGDARGASASEARALVAYARSDFDRGIAVVDLAVREPSDALGQARLEGTRGMLEHARGRAEESARAFRSAVDLATRAGAVVEEATYLTGLAASAVDSGSITEALDAATRAALLWERLGRGALAARAHLSRAAAHALIGARHEADLAAEEARTRALASNDARAAAFARWAIAETRPPRDARARDEVRAAERELANGADEDRIRAAARLLVWADGVKADGQRIETAAIDERCASRSAAVRWEWWGARAATSAEAGSAAARVLAEIVALLEVAAPLASRGPALAAAVKLAREIGDGDAARRLEAALRSAAEALRRGAPPAHRAALVEVAWLRTDSSREGSVREVPLAGAQVEQLDRIVRALSSRDRLRPLLEQVLDTMVLWTGVERGLLLLRAPDGRLAVRAARNLARRDLRGEQLALSTSLAKRAMDERQAVSATDALAQIGELHASVHALRLRSVLAVPLVARGDALGVVYLDDRVRRGAFGPAELSWVKLVASQAALAIADARDQALLRRAVRRAERANARLAAELGAREAEITQMRSELASVEETRFRYDEIAGRSDPMRAMLKLVDRVTTSEVPVLLIGESGTGKELVARAIHRNGSRANRAFVSENCASVPETLLESTLFGHVRGAFTGASSTRAGLFDVADGGTLFLDEIGEMPLAMQTKLLRVLQNGEVRAVGGDKVRRVDVRIVGATHRDLEAMVAKGAFREDLFYRLNVVSIRVPPLRERPQDIPLLVTRFVEKHSLGKNVKVTRSAMDRLSAFPWPGNVRQLENEIRRAIVLADERVDVGELSEEVARGGPGAAREAGLGLKARVDALETQLVKDALARTKGNQTRAAEMLGISRFGLQKMMRRLGIPSSAGQ